MVEPMLPRVGKRNVDSPQVLQKVQEMFPEKIIKGIVACKGTERTMAPPSSINPRETPFRRSISKLRSSGRVMIDGWEKYDEVSKRKIIRKSHPCRVNIRANRTQPLPSQVEADPSASSRAPEEAQCSRMECPPISPDEPQNHSVESLEALRLKLHDATMKSQAGSPIHVDKVEPTPKPILGTAA